MREIAMFVISGVKTICSFAIEKSEAKAVLIFAYRLMGTLRSLREIAMFVISGVITPLNA
jgi:hypothetical protein